MPAPLLLVSSAFLLALGAVLAKALLSPGSTALHPLLFLVAQLGGGLLVLFAFAMITGQLLWSRSLKRLAIPGLIIGAGSICTILSLYFTTASEASLIFAIQPMIVLGLAWVFLKERTPGASRALYWLLSSASSASCRLVAWGCHSTVGMDWDLPFLPRFALRSMWSGCAARHRLQRLLWH
ncbi:MAG: EamA family transporter [Marinosulfonomonas sp.]